jgi:Ca2+/Na+ antiporter
LFHSANQKIAFDRSSKIYTLLLLLLTTFVTLLTALGPRGSWKGFGGILLALFVVYVASVASAITRGAITAPEASDSDDSDDTSSEDSDSDSEVRPLLSSGAEIEREATQDIEATTATGPVDGALHASPGPRNSQKRTLSRGGRHHSLKYHLGLLLAGFASICLSGYVLSHASTTISDEIGMSDVLFAILVVSIATTLPEKFIAVLSGSRGHAGILVANTVGSNIFLLTLCMGIILVVTAGEFDAGSVNAVEVGVMMGSTVALTLTVWFGARWSRWIGAAMLVAYIAFLVLEFTTIRKVW